MCSNRDSGEVASYGQFVAANLKSVLGVCPKDWQPLRHRRPSTPFYSIDPSRQLRQ